jgi:hypothetical protein
VESLFGLSELVFPAWSECDTWGVGSVVTAAASRSF